MMTHWHHVSTIPSGIPVEMRSIAGTTFVGKRKGEPVIAYESDGPKYQHMIGRDVLRLRNHRIVVGWRPAAPRTDGKEGE